MAIERMTAIDLFAGAGGLSEGFRQAGFNILAANDFDEYSAQTFQATHPETEFLPGPIQQICSGDFLERAGISQGELTVLLGGPPCQAFSPNAWPMPPVARPLGPVSRVSPDRQGHTSFVRGPRKRNGHN